MTVYYITVGGDRFTFVSDRDDLLDIHKSFKDVQLFLSVCGFKWEDNHYGKLETITIAFSFNVLVPDIVPLTGDQPRHELHSWIAHYLADTLVGKFRKSSRYSAQEHFKKCVLSYE